VRPPAPEPVKQVEQAPPRVEAPPAPTGPTSAQVQAGYETIIRRYLESIKRYPTSREARLQRPTGKVGIAMEVSRDGSLKDASVSRSSDSLILDNAALATVRGGKFPPFPDNAYPGQATHLFNVTLEYTLEPQN
jgi:protein TonB